MELSKSNKARLTLLTVQDVANLLKMNSQVIARKLSSGEIEGYKLGKEWRVSEEQLLLYLERHRNSKQKKDVASKTIQTFIKDGKYKRVSWNQ